MRRHAAPSTAGVLLAAPGLLTGWAIVLGMADAGSRGLGSTWLGVEEDLCSRWR